MTAWNQINLSTIPNALVSTGPDASLGKCVGGLPWVYCHLEENVLRAYGGWARVKYAHPATPFIHI